MLQPFDREKLKTDFSAAKPFPHAKIDNFIDPATAKAIAAAYPSFEVALGHGNKLLDRQ